jgi:hypothetical protein
MYIYLLSLWFHSLEEAKGSLSLCLLLLSITSWNFPWFLHTLESYLIKTPSARCQAHGQMEKFSWGNLTSSAFPSKNRGKQLPPQCPQKYAGASPFSREAQVPGYPWWQLLQHHDRAGYCQWSSHTTQDTTAFLSGIFRVVKAFVTFHHWNQEEHLHSTVLAPRTK